MGNGKNGNGKKPFIDLGGNIDLGFNIKLPKINTGRPTSKINTGPLKKNFGNNETGMRQIKAGSSFDTMSSFRGSGPVKAGSSFDTSNAFKGLLATSKGGNQEIKISKEDIAKLRAGIQRFSSGGQSLGRGLRKGASGIGSKTRGPLQSIGVRKSEDARKSDLLAQKKDIQKELRGIAKPKRESALPAQNILSSLRARFGLS